jgi:choline-sulfatase
MGENRSVVVLEEYGQTRMIRNSSMKYIHRYPAGPNEFYDLEADPDEVSTEINNPAYERTITGMRAELKEWFDRYNEPERDGSKQAVKGRGQLDIVGGHAEAFAQDLVFLRDVDR